MSCNFRLASFDGGPRIGARIVRAQPRELPTSSTLPKLSPNPQRTEISAVKRFKKIFVEPRKGIMGFGDKATEDGCDVQMQTNHLSHFLLTCLCISALFQGAPEPQRMYPCEDLLNY